MLVNPFNLPSFIRHAYGYYATIRIGKCNDGHSQSLRLYLNALAIKCLVLFTGLYFLYSHINGFNYSNVHPNRVFRIVKEHGRSLLIFCNRFPIPFYRHNTLRPSVSGKQILFSHITLRLIPDVVELRTVNKHREIFVLYGQ